MSGGWLFFLEMLFGAGLVLLLAVRELWLLKRDRQRDAQDERKPL